MPTTPTTPTPTPNNLEQEHAALHESYEKLRIKFELYREVVGLGGDAEVLAPLVAAGTDRWKVARDSTGSLEILDRETGHHAIADGVPMTVSRIIRGHLERNPRLRTTAAAAPPPASAVAEHPGNAADAFREATITKVSGAFGADAERVAAIRQRQAERRHPDYVYRPPTPAVPPNVNVETSAQLLDRARSKIGEAFTK